MVDDSIGHTYCITVVPLSTMALPTSKCWWAVLLVQVLLPTLDGCIPVSSGGLAYPEDGKISWNGCYSCPPPDFTTEVHILRQSEGTALQHTTVNLGRYDKVLPASLTIVLVSVAPVEWLLILGNKKIRISRLFLLSVSPDESEVFVLGQEISATRITMKDPLSSLERIMTILKLSPLYLTSYAITTSSSEWSLRVGVTGPGSLCAGSNVTQSGSNNGSGSSGRSVLSFQRGIGIGGFSLLVLTVIGLSWWWRHRRAKGRRDRQDRQMMTAHQPGTPRRESSRVRHQVEAPAPPVYTPYDPPPPYEELPAGGAPVEDAVETNKPPPYVTLTDTSGDVTLTPDPPTETSAVSSQPAADSSQTNDGHL